MTDYDQAMETLQALSIASRPQHRHAYRFAHSRLSSGTILPIFAMVLALIAMAGDAQAQQELRRSIINSSKKAFSGVHVDAYDVVNKSWYETNIERVIDVEIDRAIAETKDKTPYARRFLSGWSQETARQLAEDVARQAFTSDSVKKELERLVEHITVNLTKQLEPSSRQAIERGLFSIQKYLGANYSERFMPALEMHIKQIHFQPVKEFSLGNLGDVAGRHAVALSGITVIIASHIAKKVLQQLTEKIFRRIIGRVASRILGRVGTAAIPVVGWVIGAGLIAFDLIQGADGALPDIQKALKSQEIKMELCNQVTLAFRQELPSILAETQNEIAMEVFNIWLTFLDKYPAILMLTRESALFRTEIVEKTPADSTNFKKLAHLVEVSLETAGKPAVLELVDRGILQKLKLLPEESHAIIVDTGSPLVLYQWSELAKEHLIPVIQLGLYRHLKPTEINKSQLLLLLEIKDPIAIESLFRLDLQDVKTALRIFPAEQIDRLVKLLSTDAMKTMVSYGSHAQSDVTKEFVRRLTADPKLIRLIGIDGLNKIFLAGGTVEDLESFLFWQTVKPQTGVLICSGVAVIIVLYLCYTRWWRQLDVPPRSKGGPTSWIRR